MLIAAFQRRPLFDNGAAVAAIVDRDLRWAEEHGIALALFPECFLLGHSYDPRTIRARASAVADAIPRLLMRVRDRYPTLILGTFEASGDQVTNNALVIERGRITRRYAKAHPNEPGVLAGTGYPVFDRDAVRFGIGICNDANHAGTATRLMEQGTRLICYPLNNMLPEATAERWRSRSPATLVARAMQTGCWIAAADVTGTHDGLVSYGCTAIVAPDGTIAARVAEGQEGVAVLNID